MVVVQISQELVDTLKLVGPVVIAECKFYHLKCFRIYYMNIIISLIFCIRMPDVDPICNYLLEIFEKKAICQQENDDEDGLIDEDEQAEFESLLISAASDLIAALAVAMGDSFVRFFDVFLPHISKYYVSITLKICLPFVIFLMRWFCADIMS